MGYQRSLAVLGLAAALFAGCRKEDAGVKPVITLLRPADGFALTVPDTLEVELDVYGEDRVDRVLISVLNADGVPVLPVLAVTPASNPARLTLPLAITNETVPSGTYRVLAEARSGDASARDEATVLVTAAPLRLRHIMVLTRPAPDQFGVLRIDSLGNLVNVNTVLADLNGSGVSSAGQAFLTIGPFTGPLTAYTSTGAGVRWVRPNQSNAGIPWFTSLDLCSDGFAHVGSTDGSLRAYNVSSGAVSSIATLQSGYRSACCAVVGQRLVIAQNAVAGPQHLLRVCQSPGGAYVTDHALDLDVVRMDARTNDLVLVYGNRNGEGVVQERSVASGGGWEPRTWPSPITAVERADTGSWIVALANGSLERFTYANAASLTIGSGSPVQDLAMDPVSGLMYAVRGQELVAFDPQSGVAGTTWALGAEGAYVLPVLNR